MSQQSQTHEIGIDIPNLTPRENEVAFEITLGKSYKEIASDLFISVHTVRNTVVRVMNKLEAKCSVDIARKVILSVDNPRQVFASVLCVAIMSFSFMCQDDSWRRGKRNSRRTYRTYKTYNHGNA